MYNKKISYGKIGYFSDTGKLYKNVQSWEMISENEYQKFVFYAQKVVSLLDYSNGYAKELVENLCTKFTKIVIIVKKFTQKK